jgi:hypothetical protein
MALLSSTHSSELVLSKTNPVLIKKALNCGIYYFSKSSRRSFISSLSQTTHAFELIHSDV